MRDRSRRPLVLGAVALMLVLSALPASSAPTSFDVQSDALGILTYFDFGSGLAVPMDPKFPHAFSQIRRSGSAQDASGVAAWFDPGFLLGAAFACLPACPPANPWENTFAATFWPQPPPHDSFVGLPQVTSPVMTMDAANARSKSAAGPMSVNEANISNLVIGSADQAIRISSLRATSDSKRTSRIVVTTSRAVVQGLEFPGGFEIASLTVEVTIRSDGTARGTKQVAKVIPAGITVGGQALPVPTESLDAVFSGLNQGLKAAGVQVRPPMTCTGAKCHGKEVVGFDFITGTRFCSQRGQLCALAAGPELEFAGGGQRYVITLGRVWAQGAAQA